MDSALLYAVLVLAVAAGWLMGRFGRRRQRDAEGIRYLPSVNALADELNTQQTERFLQSLAVSPETFDLHVSLGGLLRKRGEVERAIRVHQNLLAHPILQKAQVQQAHLELARDYIAAGLLDRAERLLIELTQNSEQREPALTLLVEIYQQERDWPAAIERLRELQACCRRRGGDGRREQLAQALAHFHCERAEESLARGELALASSMLAEAIASDPRCVRASLLEADVCLRRGDAARARQILVRIAEQDAELVVESLPALDAVFRALDDLAALRDYLLDSYRHWKSSRVLLAAVELTRELEGEAAAVRLLVERLKARPTLVGLRRLIELELERAPLAARDNLRILYGLVSDLLSRKPMYRCNHCGFSAKRLHWLCPACKSWNAIRPIHSVEGD